MTGSHSAQDEPLGFYASRALDDASSHVRNVPEHVLREAFRWVTTSEPCRHYGAPYFAAICIRHAIEAGVLKVVEPDA